VSITLGRQISSVSKTTSPETSVRQLYWIATESASANRRPSSPLIDTP
jgi:hypothetical protein